LSCRSVIVDIKYFNPIALVLLHQRELKYAMQQSLFVASLLHLQSLAVIAAPCDCPQVEVRSSGVAAEAQSQYLGVYSISGNEYNSMATWEQEGGEGSIFIGCNDEFCCQDCWSIGLVDLALPVKLLTSSPSSFACPYSTDLSWTVWNGGSWEEDTSLEVVCKRGDETTTETFTESDATTSIGSTSSRTSSSPGDCSGPWLPAYDVGLGCLLLGAHDMEGLTQPGAKAACRQRGAQLVEVYNNDQFEFLKLLASEAELVLMEELEFAPWWWIGLTDQGSDGSWYWEESGTAANFTNWDIGEPSHGETYNCVQMESVVELEGGWLSLRCEEATPAIFPICQKY